jgi:hypothetical protein
MDQNKGQGNMGQQFPSSPRRSSLDLFQGAPRFAYIYKKTEKIVTALYMVTVFLSDNEPLKWKMRQLGADMLSIANSLKDKFSTERDDATHRLRSHVLEITSLLDIARWGGLMSAMNTDILKGELAELGKNSDGPGDYGMNSESVLIDKSFFEDGMPERPRDPMGGKPVAGGAIADRFSGMPRSTAQPKGQKMSQRTPSVEHHTQISAEKAEKKGRRRDSILAIIRRKGEVTIKDISLSMQEVSEKTIQRELLSLVDEGVLKKEGERRWSRYSVRS